MLQRPHRRRDEVPVATTTGPTLSPRPRPPKGRPARTRRHRSLYILHVGHDRHPEGVVRDNGGHMVALKWTMKNLNRARTRFWAASDDGWVVGHSYIVYGRYSTVATIL